MRHIWMLCALMLSLTTSVSTAEALAPSVRSHGPQWTRAVKGGHKSKRKTHHSANSPQTAAAALATGSDPVLFGDQNVEAGPDANSAGWAEAFPFTDSASGSAESITVYVDSLKRGPDLARGSLQRPQRPPRHATGSGNQDVTDERRLEHRHDRIDGSHLWDQVLGGAAWQGRRAVLPRPSQR